MRTVLFARSCVWVILQRYTERVSSFLGTVALVNISVQSSPSLAGPTVAADEFVIASANCVPCDADSNTNARLADSSAVAKADAADTGS